VQGGEMVEHYMKLITENADEENKISFIIDDFIDYLGEVMNRYDGVCDVSISHSLTASLIVL